jgi:hypothetical protein
VIKFSRFRQTDRQKERAYYIDINCFRWKHNSHCDQKGKTLRKILTDYLGGRKDGMTPCAPARNPRGKRTAETV